MKALRTLLLSLVLASACIAIASVTRARNAADATSGSGRPLPPAAAALAADIARAEGECALAANPAAARVIQFGF